LKVKNIRWIHHQIGRTPAMQGLSLKDAKAAFKKVCVDYRVSDLVTFSPPSSADNKTWLDASKILPGGSGLILCVGDYNVDDIQRLFPHAVRGTESRLIFCDVQFDMGPDAPVDKSHNVDADVAEVTLHPLADVDPDDDPALLTHSLKTGAPAASATWRTRDAGALLNGEIPSKNLKIDYANHPNELVVTLPKAARDALVAGRLLKIKTTCHYAKGPYNGWTPDAPSVRTVVIALRDSSGVRPSLEWNKTIVHEVGHMMNMVKNVAIPNMDIATHGRAYDNARGGSGTHCADHVSDAHWNSGGVIASAWDPTCVMYHAGRDEKHVEFCDRCKPFVLGQDLSNLT
jgi:hypothetical protein